MTSLIRWELRAALKSTWFLVTALVFFVGGLSLVAFATNSSVLGTRGFARGLAALAHLAMVFVPLMALIPSTGSIAGDRELGNMSFLLSQPLSRSTVYGSRWGGLAGALLLCLALSFGSIGMFAATRGVRTGLVLSLLGLTAALAVAFVSIGLWVSASSRTRGEASILGLSGWLVFVALGSLGVMTAFVRWGLPETALRAWVLVNPVEAYRLAVLTLLGADPETLGAVGHSAAGSWGAATVPLCLGSLAVWALVAGWVGLACFRRADF